MFITPPGAPLSLLRPPACCFRVSHRHLFLPLLQLPPPSHSLPPSLRTCLIFLSFVSPASSTALPCKCWRNPKGTPPTQSPQAPSSPRHESIQRKLLPEPLLLLLLLTRQPQGFIICLTIIFSYPPTASICKISTSPSFSGKCTPPTVLYNLSFTVNLSYKHVGSERSAE